MWNCIKHAVRGIRGSKEERREILSGGMREEGKKTPDELREEEEARKAKYPGCWYSDMKVPPIPSLSVSRRVRAILYPTILNQICTYVDGISQISLLVSFRYFDVAGEAFRRKRKTLIQYQYFDRRRYIPALYFDVRHLAEGGYHDILIWISQFLGKDESVGNILYEGILRPDIFKMFHPSLVEECTEGIQSLDNRCTRSFYELNPTGYSLCRTLMRMMAINDVTRVSILKIKINRLGFRVGVLQFSRRTVYTSATPTMSTIAFLWNMLRKEEKRYILKDQMLHSFHIDPEVRAYIISRRDEAVEYIVPRYEEEDRRYPVPIYREE